MARRRNVRRDATDLVRPPSDSKSLPLVSARGLLRVAALAEALSRRLEEENRNGQTGEHAEDAAAVAVASGCHAAPAGMSGCADAAPAGVWEPAPGTNQC